MKIALAQIRPFPGDLDGNLDAHQHMILQAAQSGAELILFPELSLTAYEPRLASALAVDPMDDSLNLLQVLSDEYQICIAAGMPTRAGEDIRISLLIFQPGQARQVYSKQYLHADEEPYFSPGQGQVLMRLGKHTLAPAICYESLLPQHAADAHAMQTDIYLASVAKSAKGIEKAFTHYPAIARQYGMYVLMANCTGPCDDFESAGQSAAWNSQGEFLASLQAEQEGLLLVNIP